VSKGSEEEKCSSVKQGLFFFYRRLWHGGGGMLPLSSAAPHSGAPSYMLDNIPVSISLPQGTHFNVKWMSNAVDSRHGVARLPRPFKTLRHPVVWTLWPRLCIFPLSWRLLRPAAVTKNAWVSPRFLQLIISQWYFIINYTVWLITNDDCSSCANDVMMITKMMMVMVMGDNFVPK